jgi:hypothetical protein
VAPSLTAPVYGQTLTFTATVSATGATPTGSVQFAIDGTPFGSPVPLDTNGQATSGGIACLTATGHTVTATFIPTGAFLASASQPTPFTVTPATLTGTVTTQGALNLAKQGTFTITISNVAGLANGDTLATALSGAQYFLTIGADNYAFAPTSVTTSGNNLTITYSLKNPALVNHLAADLANATSAATAVSAGFLIESANYTLTDADLTRLFMT